MLVFPIPLYTVICGFAGTKKTAATWVKNEFKSVWINNLIEAAESWNYSKGMFLKDKTIDFIKFTIDEIKKTKLYHELDSEKQKN